MGTSLQFTFSTDSQGFLSQQCPKCKERFKVKFGSGMKAPLAFCIYCGHKGKDCWFTVAQARHVNAVANQYALKEMNKALGAGVAGSKFVTFTPSRVPMVGQPPSEPEESWPIANFVSGEQVKYTGENRSNLYCPVTGEKLILADEGGKYQDRGGLTLPKVD